MPLSTATGLDSELPNVLLEIIGAAANALSDESKERHPDVQWRHLVNLRHLLAHHYHRVDVDQIWTIASVNVPHLAQALSTSLH